MTSEVEQEYERAQFELDVARERYNEAKLKLFLEKISPKANALIGTIWKFRNCYSCPRVESDYWWKYRIFTRFDDRTLYCNDIQIDKNGELKAEQEEEVPISLWFGHGPNFIVSEEWIQIKKSDSSLKSTLYRAMATLSEIERSIK